jgi:hypothetical protein
MKRFKVEQMVLCEVRVWGWVQASSIEGATALFLQTDTGNSDYDHEIITDIRTISLEVKEDKQCS